MSKSSALPPGYTFLNIETFISTKAKAIGDKLLEDSGKRDPDAFGMYIYNDFYSYGVLDLVDNTLLRLHAEINKKDWEQAYVFLEALITFVEFELVWTQCDDGDHVKITAKTIGTCAVAVLRGLKAKNQLDSDHFPNLENLLEKICSFAKEMNGMFSFKQDYDAFCRAVARRLFKSSSQADFELKIQRLNEWADSLVDEEEKKISKTGIKKLEKKGVKKPWFTTGKVHDEDDRSAFNPTSVWKTYKECLANSPRVPMRGPAKWDLSEWTAEERREFEFDAMDSDNGF